MGTRKTHVRVMLGLMVLAVSGCSGGLSLQGQQATPTTAQKIASLSGRDDDSTFSWYLNHQVEWAKLHEADGDLLRAKGDATGALAAYQKAMAEVGVGASWPGWKLERASGGQRVLEVVPGGLAALAKILPGDLLVAKDGILLAGLDTVRLEILFCFLDGMPVRPHIFSIRRGESLFEMHIDRLPILKELANQGERTYREALEQKLLGLILETGLEPEVNDNMRWAAKETQRSLRDAKDAKATEYARDNVRGAAYGFPGWADYYLNCGLLLEAAGDATEAEKCYRNFLTMRPGAPQAAAVAARFTSLGPLVRHEQNLRAWEGSWRITKNGQGTERGYLFERNGKLIEAKNYLGEVWMRGTINDEFNGSVLQSLTAKAMAGGLLAGLIDKCFGGKLEVAGTMRLSQDKQSLTITVNNDIDIDPSNCAIVRQNPSALVYVR